MAVLVTGGAGYIGAHVVRLLADEGVRTGVIDDLSTGDPSRIPGVPLYQLDLADPANKGEIARILLDGEFDAVMHFAAKKSVPESVERPAHYYQQNLGSLSVLLEAMAEARATRLVFSSSAAVYGDVAMSPVSEDAPTRPVNPYGETKLAGEWLVAAAAAASGIRVASLRYFNVAGAGWPDLGDPTIANLVTLVLDKIERDEAPVVFGADYPTADGSCVRDFVHVLDLAEAHVAAIGYLEQEERPFSTFNVGTGSGTSVLEMVDRLLEATGSGLRPVLRGRRAGDPAEVVASTARIERVLGWRARFGLDDIAGSAVAAWRRQHD
ncbi:MAG TPA: UDP-glucose 4-epimerase GalE [Propionicimonas sp.]